MNYKFVKKLDQSITTIVFYKNAIELNEYLSIKEVQIVKEQLKERSFYIFQNINFQTVIVDVNQLNTSEDYRVCASKIFKDLIDSKKIQLLSSEIKEDALLPFIEGLLLSNYRFEKYKSEPKKAKLSTVLLEEGSVSKKSMDELLSVVQNTLLARDLVNEPVNKLNTETIVSKLKALDKLNVEILRKSKISALKMGGLLAVNQGSNEEPAFAVLEWKPKKANNKKPIVLVGKGVLFDTGGANIKTGNFMTNMKSDMGGAAAIVGAINCVAENNLPVHVVALLPITENRINGSEIVPGDVIKMFNGKTVEVLNTDAEGRLILADALAYAKKYKPEMVLDLATLTGSAVRALGHNGAVIMGTLSEKDKKILKKSAEKTHERVWEFPMWPEFEESLKSNVADINNLGEGNGQMVCAGFFLKNFVDYPWLHIDIAGPSFIEKSNNYLSKGGTGYGTRLLYQFIKDKFV